MSENVDVQSLLSQLDKSKARCKQLEEELANVSARLKHFEVEKNVPATAARMQAEATLDIAPINEADQTLRRLIQRIAMILQAEKIVIMFYDRESGELNGIPPTFGVEDDKLRLFRIRATHGISGLVFRESQPVVFHDAQNDPRTQEDPFGLLHVKNGVSVPLVIEKRDEENRVVERTTIGVLHAFNRRNGAGFDDEDVRLLERMARNVGAIISNLQMYREVVEEREELIQTFESITAGLLLVSPEGRISQINASARAILDLAADCVGKQIADYTRNTDLLSAIEDASTASEGNKREIVVVIGGSERIFEVQTAQVRGEDAKSLGVVIIMNDITEVKSIDKMKSSFVAMASHELRTPLTAIKGFSSTLLEGIDQDIYSKDDQREFLGIVVTECDRLRRLIDDLLNTSRIESGESLKPNYSEFHLQPLLDKVVMVQQKASTKHKILLDVQGDLPDTIVADEDKLDQIFTNLLNNAIKYSPNGGDVTVHAVVSGDMLLFDVEDQGLGIPKEHLTKVFERFHRVNNEDNRKIYGTGLGLFLVQHLVEQVHMGKVWCESEVGVGSHFKFTIPVKLDIEKAKEQNN